MNVRSLLAYAGVIALVASPSLAFDIATPANVQGGDPQVIGGVPAIAADWPATLIFRSGTGGCTATVVGDGVALTAAHCMPDGDSGRLMVNGRSVNVTCNHHPEYALNPTADYALCDADGNIVRNNVAFERVATSIAYPQVGDDVTLLGYGCRMEGGVDQAFGVLFTGLSQVVLKPGANSLDTVTEGGAAVCFGDSGGAAFVVNGDYREIIALNRAGNIATRSYLASTYVSLFIDWAVDWSRQHQKLICGIHLDARNCRI